MIPNLSSLPPSPFKLHSSCVSAGDLNREDIENISEHFPTRNIEGFSEQRQLEHLGVARSVGEVLKHDNWHLLYEADGAPVLHEYHKPSSKSISITHAKINDDVYVFIATSEKSGKKIGIDLTVKGDSRLQRIAPRTMNPQEVAAERLEEVWAIKEAMFKSLGPGIDFKDELLVEVEDILAGKEYVRGLFHDQISRWWVADEEQFVLALGPC